jgi:hypothetical protein
LASRPGRLSPMERAPDTHWIGDWVDTRAGLEGVEKRTFLTLPGLELRSLGRPARSQSLYRLRHPGSLHKYIYIYIYIYSRKKAEVLNFETDGRFCSQR